MTATGIGASVRRKEDQRFVTGRGHYVDDLTRPGQAYATFLRSPHAHATIRSIDTTAAKAKPGVLAVLTGEDLAADKVGGLICGWMIHSKDGTPMKAGPHPALALGKVRYVGDHVAVVVAETLAQAKDAAEAIAVDYETLPAVVDAAEAQTSPAQIHEVAPDNTVFRWHLGDKAAVDQAFATAKHVTKLDIANNRLVPNAIEPRAAIGEYDPGTESYTLRTTSQNPHVARLVLSAFIGIAPEHKLRVVAPDVGGGFGSKIFIYAEETICLWAAKKVGRPVKWNGDRTEAFLCDAHGRDHVTHAEMATAEDGKILAIRVSTIANLGAYLSTFASSVPTYLYAPLLSGQYDIPAIYCEVDGVYTNTAPVDAYRGAGRPEATFVVERLVEVAAREIGMDPAKFRRRNYIKKFPHQTPVIMTYDAGDYQASLAKALELADYNGFARRKRESARNGKLRGIGFSSYIEACGIAPSAAVGSRSGAVGMSAIYKAIDKVIAKGKKVAAYVMEAAEGDIEFKDGKFSVAGTDKSVAFGDMALQAYIAHKFSGQELEPGLKEGAFYDPTNFTFPAGVHICEVEVDPDTGIVAITKWTAVDDFGVVINPMIVEGQVHGGVAQGVGQALHEGAVYDKSGQLVTASYMDYQMPRAEDLPSLTVGMTVTPCPSNPLGVKGCGEAGAIAAPAAVINALTDALGHEDLAMPATPQAVWRAARKARVVPMAAE